MRKTIARAHGEMPSEDRTGWEDSPGERRRARSDQPGQNYRQQLLRPREIGGARILGTHGDGGYDFTDYFRALSGGAFQEALAPAGRGGHAHLARRRRNFREPRALRRGRQQNPGNSLDGSEEGNAAKGGGSVGFFFGSRLSRTATPVVASHTRPAPGKQD